MAIESARSVQKAEERRRKLERKPTLSRDSLIASIGGEDKCNRARATSIMRLGVHRCSGHKKDKRASGQGLYI